MESNDGVKGLNEGRRVAEVDIEIFFYFSDILMIWKIQNGKCSSEILMILILKLEEICNKI